MAAPANKKTFTVPNNSTLSDQIDLGIVDGNSEVVGFVVVGTVISTTFSLKVSDDGVLFQTLNDQAGSLITISIASNTNVGLSQDKRAQVGRWRYAQAVMGSSETGGASIRVLVK